MVQLTQHQPTDYIHDHPVAKNLQREVIGLVLFIAVFMLATPYALFHTVPHLFPYYIANVDILANIISTIDHPSIFSNLYNAESTTLIEYLSIIIINFGALVSLVWVVLHYHRKRPISKSMQVAAAMIFITFIIPTYLIPFYDQEVRPKIKQYIDDTTYSTIVEYLCVGLFGASFLIFEHWFISTFVL